MCTTLLIDGRCRTSSVLQHLLQLRGIFSLITSRNHKGGIANNLYILLLSLHVTTPSGVDSDVLVRSAETPRDLDFDEAVRPA